MGILKFSLGVLIVNLSLEVSVVNSSFPWKDSSRISNVSVCMSLVILLLHLRCVFSVEVHFDFHSTMPIINRMHIINSPLDVYCSVMWLRCRSWIFSRFFICNRLICCRLGLLMISFAVNFTPIVGISAKSCFSIVLSSSYLVSFINMEQLLYLITIVPDIIRSFKLQVELR